MISVDSTAKHFTTLVLAALLVFADGCTTATAPVVSETNARKIEEPSPPAPPASAPVAQQKRPPQSGYHIVDKGDTLYSIAWRYNLDYLDLAAWNDIGESYIIYPKQVLRLKSGLTQLKAESLKPKTPPEKPPVAEPVPLKKKIADLTPQNTKKGPPEWIWPTSGKIVKSDSPTSRNGINIVGQHGQLIKASASGEVVYSGNGILGYGNLIIIKHNKTYLSAYAHNSELLVEEGAKVSAGQKISKMGRGHSNQALLYFEIRKRGKPANPLNYLPKSPS